MKIGGDPAPRAHSRESRIFFTFKLVYTQPLINFEKKFLLLLLFFILIYFFATNSKGHHFSASSP